MVTAINRASSAQAAGDVIWPQRQRQALAAFQTSLSGLLYKEAKLRQTLTAVFHAEGVTPVSISHRQVMAFKASIASGWSPEQRALLASWGGDDVTIEAARLLILAQDAMTMTGQFPDILAAPDVLATLRTASSVLKGISIDIGGRTHRINPRERDVFKVEVFSTPSFDASTIDPLTVRFGPNAASEAFAASFERQNKQGLLELTFHFRGSETGIMCGDTFAVITGKLVNGEPFFGRGVVNMDCNDDDDNGHREGDHRNGGQQLWNRWGEE